MIEEENIGDIYGVLYGTIDYIYIIYILKGDSDIFLTLIGKVYIHIMLWH